MEKEKLTILCLVCVGKEPIPTYSRFELAGTPEEVEDELKRSVPNLRRNRN